jgi:PAS domain S-box-containing protein
LNPPPDFWRAELPGPKNFYPYSALASMNLFAQHPSLSMSRTTAIRPHVFVSLALTVLVALLGLMLLDPGWRPGAVILHTSYDSLHSLSGIRSEATTDSPVVLVYLDLKSFLDTGQNPAQPWPRELHAKLLRRLTAAGARAVVFDIVFSKPGPAGAADQALTEAIRANGRVILAAEFSNTTAAPDDKQVWARLGSVEPLYEPLVQAAAAWGIATLGIDDDRVVRRFVAGFESDAQPTLAWAAASLLRLPAVTNTSMQAANQFWIRHYGPPFTIPHISYSQALDSLDVDDGFFRDKVVFVGSRPWVESINAPQDAFRNPFHSWKYRDLFMPGVEVHATELLNLIRGDWLRRLSRAKEMVILLAVGLLFGGGLVWLRPIPATIIALAGAGVALGVSLAGFSRGVWFPWLIISAVQIPVALGGSVLFYSVEWYRARKRFEAAKRIADAKIREQAALIDKAHDAILVQDLDDKILYANPSAERLYGWKLDALQRDGATAEIFLPDEKAAGSARTAALKDGEWNGELRQQTRAGQIVTVASRWTLIRDETSQPKALLIINSDVTGQKQLEAQFLRTQRMNTIGTLAGGMAHDLNNALAPILMGVQLLRRQAGDEESRRWLAMIESSTHRGADMVRQVLLFARGRGGEFQRLELGVLVKELEQMVRETFPKNITVETFLPGDLWPVRGNPTQLHQVLLNLCVNARDAMPEGGKLSFVADNVELAAAEAAAIPDGQPGEFVSLLVSDTGTGIPPEVRAKIFEPFFTTKGEGRGTGIGLSTVMRIVKSHGGFLHVESEPGQGTTFEVFLPRAVETAPTEIAAATVGPARGQGELILVADDEQAICELLTAELTSCGYRVLAASNGEEAVQLFQKHAGEVRLLITDCAMPVMDGPQAIRTLREKRPELPVILASGEGGADADKVGDVVLVNKPFTLEEILSAVQNCLRSER